MQNKYLERIYNGLIKENPTLVLMLGMCPTLAVSTAAINGISMGLSTLAVLVLSNFLISVMRNVIPDDVRLPAYIVIVASLVTVVKLLIKAYLPSVDAALGEGKDAGESMQAALAAMAQSVLDQLPTLFLQAGLQLIAQGQWALGLGFVAAAGSTAFIDGYVKGKQNAATEENALGGVYGDAGYRAFAKGGTFTNAIVTSPTFFKFARGAGFGTGLMGEAGPEAVMPLTRGADGSLGVDASGIGAGDWSLTVVINNYSASEVTAEETTDEESGQRRLEITIGSMINSHLSSGKADKAMKSRYGLRAQGV